MHEGSKTYPCPVPECSEVFNKWLLLCAHKKVKHVTEHKCTSCDKVFLNKTNLRTHSKIHSENRTVIPCPYDGCQRTYYFKSNLECHVRVKHLGEKFVCDMCSFRFSSKQKLIEHIRHQEQKERSKPKKKLNAQRKKRKDAGIPKRSVLTRLIGLDLPSNLEKLVMEREEVIAVSNKEVVVQT
ncbi:hypothetical protein DMN91_006108 [Ooceraea biroi]|uniref:C2H2-type domain-containing protein n=2 Tax=Ooceraea biroi TaxID=2015173 RepID=A0A3L8DND4_OOCBI|nr:hypothetical protein DMN91_006108 [Ooceraea biroi]